MNIIFDLDGTLANCEHRLRFIRGTGREGPGGKKDWKSFHEYCSEDAPIFPVMAVFRALVNEGHNVKIWSGRNSSVRVKTCAWLAGYLNDKGDSTEELMQHFNSILTMRPEGDYTPDHIMKESWLHALPRAEWPVLVFDDRASVVEMWRRNGIRCAQVAPGDF